MTELAENKPGYSSFPSIKKLKLQKPVLSRLALGKQKTGNLVVPSQELYLVF